MRKFWSVCLKGTLAIALLGSNLALGNDLTPKKAGTSEKDPLRVAPAPPKEQSENHAGLTPRRKTEKPIVLAQNAPQPAFPLVAAMPAAPTLAPIDVPTSNDGYVIAELERLSAEIAKLKKDTKKPDTKKGWSSPKLTGRMFLDYFATSQSDNADLEYPTDPFRNKAGIREMQFAISGNGFDAFDYKMELALSPTDGEVNLVDNWIGAKNLPLFGYMRAGHFKPETGFNYPASALHTSLTEFSGPSATFGFGRRFGIASETLYCKDRVRLFYGVFQDGATNRSRFLHEDNQGEVFNMRLSMAPIYADEGRQLLHIGGHWSYVSSRADSTSLSIKPGSIAWYGNSMSTGNFSNNNHHRAGVELVCQHGPFSAQSEAFVAKYAAYDTAALGFSPERTATGAYVEFKYFLTGEFRTYNLKKGMFGAAKVNRNFHPVKVGDFNLIDGFGALQAVMQWSYLDLGDWRADPNAKAGRQHDLTVGMNWFWTPNLRWIFEYTHSQQNVGAAYRHCYEDIFGTSLRVHF